MLIDCLVNLIRGKGSVNFDNPVYHGDGNSTNSHPKKGVEEVQ